MVRIKCNPPSLLPSSRIGVTPHCHHHTNLLNAGTERKGSEVGNGSPLHLVWTRSAFHAWQFLRPDMWTRVGTGSFAYR
jgi:hypothetical protein